MRILPPFVRTPAAAFAFVLAFAATASGSGRAALGGYEYVSPDPGSQRVSRWNNVVLRPGGPLEGVRLGASDIDVSGSVTGRHPGRLTLSDDRRTLVFSPARPFAREERVQVRFDASVAGRDGRALAPLAFTFDVGGADPATVSRVGLERLYDDVPGFAASPAAAHPLSDPRRTTANNCTLPTDYPLVFVKTTNHPDPGVTFVAPFFGSQAIGRLLILDNNARPLFFRRLPSTALDFTRQPSGLLTYFGERGKFWGLDSAYTVVDSFAMGNGYGTDNHDLQILPNGHALLMAYDVQPVDMSVVVPGGRANAKVVGLIVQEIDASKQVVFQWRSWDHFQITDADTCVISLRDSLVDYVHGNAVERDTDGNLLISSRSMNEITKIDRSTGAIIWRMGRNARQNEFTFPNDLRGFKAQHDIRRLANGHVTLFDNGNCQTPAYSRAIEYQLDEVNKEATLVWEYRNAPDSYGGFMGNVQRRSDGGTTIGWGGTGPDPKFTDLHADGTEGFEIGFGFSAMWTYRAFRFPWTTSRFAVSPDTVDFGPIAAGSAAQRLITVRNRSSQPLTITCFESTDSTVRMLTSLPFTIAGGSTSAFSIEATGTGFGSHSGALYVRSGNDTTLVAQAIGFKSNVAAPAPAVSPLLGALLGALLAALAAVRLGRRSAS